METERKVKVIGDVGVDALIGLSDVAEPGAKEFTEYEQALMNSMRILLRGRIEVLLKDADGDPKEE